MKRREFLTLIGGAVAFRPLAGHAQPAESARRIGVLIGTFAKTDRQGQDRIAAFLDTFQKLGWSDGRNFRMDYHWGAGNSEEIAVTAKELLRATPDVIVVSGNAALAELRRQTSTIPIVFIQISDPVGSGFVASLARPGGNVSGFQNFEPAMGGKWLGVLKEAAPGMSRVAVVFGSDTAANTEFLRAAEAVAPSLGVQVTPVDVSPAKGRDSVTTEMSDAITKFASEPNGGMIVMPHIYTAANRGSIIALAARYRLPAVYPFPYFAIEGGMMSYGPNQIDQWRGAATYVDRILRGGKPSDLPVQQPTKFELVINLRTAKARAEHPTGISAPRGSDHRIKKRRSEQAQGPCEDMADARPGDPVCSAPVIFSRDRHLSRPRTLMDVGVALTMTDAMMMHGGTIL
jgi:putative tryptophan/tyrosine transport system substrate-binding protein